MTYLMMQMLLCLLIAFLLGAVLGWWLGRRGFQEQVREIEDRGQRRHDECRNELESCRKERDLCGDERASLREELAVCQLDLEACLNQPALPDAAATSPVALADLGTPAAPVTGEPAGTVQTATTVPPATTVSPASKVPPATTVPLAAAIPAAAAPTKKDDLKKIEGIGPKIESLLNAKGIETWEQLAGADVSFLRSVLDEAGPRFRMHDPGSWPRQGGLASKGEWAELEALQEIGRAHV